MFNKSKTMEIDFSNVNGVINALDTITKRLDNMELVLEWLVKHNADDTSGMKSISYRMTNMEQGIQSLLLRPTPKPVETIPEVVGYTNAIPPRRKIKVANGHKRWEDAEMCKLIELDALGLSAKQIAKNLGRTHRAVSAKLTKLKLGR